MSVHEVRHGDMVWHQGRSQLSGYRTRLFHDPKDAVAEEEWLDGQWLAARAYWSAAANVRERILARRATWILEKLATDAQRGMRLVTFDPGSELGEEDWTVWKSNRSHDENNFHVVLMCDAELQHEWVGCIQNQADLIDRVETLKSEWQLDELSPESPVIT